MIVVLKLAWITMIIMTKNYSILEMKEYTLSQERNASHNSYSKL